MINTTTPVGAELRGRIVVYAPQIESGYVVQVDESGNSLSRKFAFSMKFLNNADDLSSHCAQAGPKGPIVCFHENGHNGVADMRLESP